MARTLSAKGAAVIAKHEGKANHLYNDPAGHCTIGIGHLVHRGNCNGSEPEAFRRGLSDQEVYDLFISDASRFIDAVNGLVDVDLSQNQFDALVSFAFNVGIGALEGSTLLRKLNAGDYAGAAQEFGKWVKADGRTLPGLVSRRAAEARLFLTPDDDQEVPVAGLDNLHPVFAQRVANACRARGTSVYSGARSTERQRQLYNDYLAGRGNPANPPGTSWHEYGEGLKGGTYALAVDFAEPYPHGEPGLIFPIKGEPWHAQPSEISEPARTAGAERRLPAVSTPPPQPVLEEDDMRIINVAGRGIYLCSPGHSKWIDHPDKVIELVRVGVPYVSDQELPGHTFDALLATSSTTSNADAYPTLLAEVRERLA
jgi:GH24 family phage-related lysozyme (muramidase)